MKQWAAVVGLVALFAGPALADNGTRSPGIARLAAPSRVYAVADFPGATNMAKLQAAIASSRPNSTILVTSSMTVTSGLSITKPLTLIVEAGVTLTTVGQVTINADNVTVRGRGWTSHIQQGTTGTDVFVLNGHTGFSVQEIDAIGTGTAGATPASGNSLVVGLGASSDLTVDHVRATNFLYYAVWTKGTSRVSITNSTFVGNMAWLAAGGTGLAFHNNTVRDDFYATTSFLIPLQFDAASTSGFGVCTDVAVTINRFLNWPQSQAILLHTAKHFVTSGNILNNVLIGIQMAPVAAGDLVEDGVAEYNIVTGSTSSGLNNTFGSYLIAASGVAAQNAKNIEIAHNYVTNGNAWPSTQGNANSDFWGGIGLNYTTDVKVHDNTLNNNYGNGIAANGPNSGLDIQHNHITGTQNSNGLVETCIGVWTTAGQSGVIAYNYCDTVKEGIRFDVSSAFRTGPNFISNTSSSRITNPANATINQVTDGATFPAGTGTQFGAPVVGVYENTTSVPSVTTGETDGQVFTLPANTLSANGQSLICWTGFTKAANANTVTHKFYIFGTAILSSATGSSGVVADSRVEIIRVSSSSVRYFQTFESAGGTVGTSQGALTGLTFSGANTIKNTVTGATANADTAATFLRCDWKP